MERERVAEKYVRAMQGVVQNMTAAIPPPILRTKPSPQIDFVSSVQADAWLASKSSLAPPTLRTKSSPQSYFVSSGQKTVLLGPMLSVAPFPLLAFLLLFFWAVPFMFVFLWRHGSLLGSCSGQASFDDYLLPPKVFSAQMIITDQELPYISMGDPGLNWPFLDVMIGDPTCKYLESRLQVQTRNLQANHLMGSDDRHLLMNEAIALDQAFANWQETQAKYFRCGGREKVSRKSLAAAPPGGLDEHPTIDNTPTAHRGSEDTSVGNVTSRVTESTSSTSGGLADMIQNAHREENGNTHYRDQCLLMLERGMEHLELRQWWHSIHDVELCGNGQLFQKKSLYKSSQQPQPRNRYDIHTNILCTSRAIFHEASAIFREKIFALAVGQKTLETIDECDGDSEDGDSDEDVSDDIDGRLEGQNIVDSFKDANGAIGLLEKRDKALGKNIATKAEIVLINKPSNELCD
ncbi:hypothetical protein BDR22DRAFT_823674 [Usnea florida]